MGSNEVGLKLGTGSEGSEEGLKLGFGVTTLSTVKVKALAMAIVASESMLPSGVTPSEAEAAASEEAKEDDPVESSKAAES